jgi:hypothetical protein
MCVRLRVADEMSQSTTADASAGYSPSALFGVVADGQTYKNLLYLALAFPLGMLYFTVLITGFALGVGLSVLVVGVGVLLVMLVGVRALGTFERGLANRLLGTDIRPPDDITPDGDGLVALGKAYVGATSTWHQFVFLTGKFFAGILSFVLLSLFVGVSADLVLAPVFPEGAVGVQINDWTVAETFETTAQQALAVPTGLVIGLVGLHLLNAFARVNASVASSLLGGETSEHRPLAE